MLDVRRLRILREVARRGTLAAAAEALSYTPSAVSQHVAALERQTGVMLLERRGRRVRLTSAAETLVAHTETILADLELAEADLAATSDVAAGPLRLAAFPTAASTFAPRAIADVERRHPAVSVTLRELETDDSLPGLELDRLDVAVAYRFAPHDQPAPGLERDVLFADPLLVALPADHAAAASTAVSLATLAGERWVSDVQPTLCRRLLEQACGAAGFAPRVGFESNDFRVFQSLVAAGLAVALLPGLACDTPLDGVAVRPVAGQVVEREVFVAVRRGSGTRPAIAAMVGALREAAQPYARSIAAAAR
jgi:DNA-binding transcriptional LysR family regulator